MTVEPEFIKIANEKLELVRPDALYSFMELAEKYDHMTSTKAATAMRKSGELMTKDELKENGMRGNTIMSHDVFDMLTEKGQDDPVNSVKRIMLSASRLWYRNLEKERIRNMPPGWRVQIFAPKKCEVGCAAFGREGLNTTKDRIPSFPLQGCVQDVCFCSVSPTPDRKPPTFIDRQPARNKPPRQFKPSSPSIIHQDLSEKKAGQNISPNRDKLNRRSAAKKEAVNRNSRKATTEKIPLTTIEKIMFIGGVGIMICGASLETIDIMIPVTAILIGVPMIFISSIKYFVRVIKILKRN